MNDDVFVEMECRQFIKTGQEACGDDYQLMTLEEENRAIAVLSDGLGSGIKANMLANMTTTMALKFMRSNLDLPGAVETMMDALPVCEVRHISYATFSIVDLRLGGTTKIIEMGNPRYIHLRGEIEVPPYKHERFVSPNWPDREVDTYNVRMQTGDRLIIASDGVTQAGVGQKKYKFGWRRSGELEFARDLIRRTPDISARDLANAIAFQALSINPEKCADDISCLVIYLRKPRVMRILTGPPYHREHDRDFALLATAGADNVVICGGTTANILERELGKKVKIDLKLIRADDELPPPGIMDGVGLTTEGILTLSKVCSLLEKGDPSSPIPPDAPMAARLIINRIEESDRIEFIVGTKVNEAHQDPNLPLELELRRNVVKRIAEVLEKKYRKKVDIKYY